jgi:hypothetical protein
VQLIYIVFLCYVHVISWKVKILAIRCIISILILLLSGLGGKLTSKKLLFLAVSSAVKLDPVIRLGLHRLPLSSVCVSA